MLKELKDGDFIVSKTDLKGKLTYINQIFMDIGEYTEAELLGQPHNIIRNPKMPRAVFKLFWEKLQKQEEIFAYVLNKTKNGNEYWVYANGTPSLDVNGRPIGYYSVRRKANPDALRIIEPLYAKMLQAEKSGGMQASSKILEDVLNHEGMTYDEFIINLQK